MSNDDDKRLRTLKATAITSHTTLPLERKAFLTVIGGSYADLGKHITVERSVVVGRAPSCDLILEDHGVSWKHATVTPRSGETFQLQDLGSTNGTLVNGLPIDGGWFLQEGQRLQIHNSTIRFSLADEAEVRFHQELAHLISTDPLTGMMSKRRFDHTLDHTLLSARHSQTPVAVVMMDLDGIKSINDTHGHLFGAHSIATAGRLIDDVVKITGQACRYGGDEFIAFLTHQPPEAALQIGERIRRTVERAGIVKDGIPLFPTISIGIAVFPADGSTALELIAAADKALYQAKDMGKNRVCLYQNAG